MIKLDFEQRRRADELMEYGFDEPDAIAEELIYLRGIISGMQREAVIVNWQAAEALCEPDWEGKCVAVIPDDGDD